MQLHDSHVDNWIGMLLFYHYIIMSSTPYLQFYCSLMLSFKYIGLSKLKYLYYIKIKYIYTNKT